MLDKVMIALEIMWKGMAGIFIATLLIIGVVWILSKIVPKDNKKQEEK